MTFIQGDFTEQEVYDSLLESLKGREVDLVMSDLAPNISGTRAVDQPKAMYLADLALDLATQVLSKGGGFVVKVFQGTGFDPYMQDCRTKFSTVRIRKPEASRGRSREVYIVATGYKG